MLGVLGHPFHLLINKYIMTFMVSGVVPINHVKVGTHSANCVSTNACGPYSDSKISLYLYGILTGDPSKDVL